MSEVQTQMPYVGALTAIKNGNVPMTVTKIIENEGVADQIECMYLMGSTLKTFYGENKVFIGLGDNLVFSGGCFTYAFADEEDDEDEEGDDNGMTHATA